MCGSCRCRPWARSVVSGGEVATPGLRGGASFEATVVPEGNATSYHFEYVDEAGFRAKGFTDASSTQAIAIGESFEEQHAEASLPAKTLTPGVSYDWRVVAVDSAGHTTDGPTQTLDEPAFAAARWSVG